MRDREHVLSSQADKRNNNRSVVDPEFLDVFFYVVNTAIGLSQLYFAWKAAQSKVRTDAPDQALPGFVDALRNIEDALREVIRAHNELTELFEVAERRMNNLFFEGPVRAGVVGAEFDQHTANRVGQLKSKLALSASSIGMWSINLIGQTSQWHLPNESHMLDGLSSIATSINEIVFGNMKFRDANRALHELVEQLERLVEGYRRSMNR